MPSFDLASHRSNRRVMGRSDAAGALYSQFGNIDVHGNASSLSHVDRRLGLRLSWVLESKHDHGFQTVESTHCVRENTLSLSKPMARISNNSQWGQVHPFWNSPFDPLLAMSFGRRLSFQYRFYQLLRGATYPHFGDLGSLRSGLVPDDRSRPTGRRYLRTGVLRRPITFSGKYATISFFCNPVSRSWLHRDRLIPAAVPR